MWQNLEQAHVSQEAKLSSSSFYYYQMAQCYEKSANEADLEGVRGTRDVHDFDLRGSLPDKLYQLIEMLLCSYSSCYSVYVVIFLPIYNT